jgi:hypothetical protein
MNNIDNLNPYQPNSIIHQASHSITGAISILQCEMCLEYTRTIRPDSPYLDNGSQITISGGYSEFFDHFSLDEPNSISINLCHDCTLKIFRMIPKLSSDKFSNNHSVAYFEENHPLCCEYSWTINPDDQTVISGKFEDHSPQTTYNLLPQ